MLKRILQLLIPVLILVFVYSIYFSISPGMIIPWSEKNTDNRILISWLNKKDPELFRRCKVVLNEKDELYSVHREADDTNITTMICGNAATFWINNKTKMIDCYTSYCGKNIGKKYCGKDIAAKACEQ